MTWNQKNGMLAIAGVLVGVVCIKTVLLAMIAPPVPTLSPNSQKIVDQLLEQKRKQAVKEAQGVFDMRKSGIQIVLSYELRIWELAKKSETDWTAKDKNWVAKERLQHLTNWELIKGDREYWSPEVEAKFQAGGPDARIALYREGKGKYKLELTKEEVIAAQQKELQEWQAEYFREATNLVEKFEGKWYPLFEARIEQYKREFPRYEIAGDISYAMSLDELKAFVKVKFKSMRQNGQILTKDEFAKLNQDEWFGTSNLTRIWGANYLAEIFKRTGQWKEIRVPNYIIVVDDLNKVRIKIEMNPCFPVIATIENGDIYAEKIKGRAGRPSNVLKEYGFTDYSGPNSVFTAEGVEYVVDTEYKSFYDGIPETRSRLYRGKYSNYTSLCEYLKNRFKLVNKIPEGEFDTIIEFDLSAPSK